MKRARGEKGAYPKRKDDIDLGYCQKDRRGLSRSSSKETMMVKKLLTRLIAGSLLAVLVTAYRVKDASTIATPTVHMGATGFIQDGITLQKRGDARSCGRFRLATSNRKRQVGERCGKTGDRPGGTSGESGL